MQAILVYGKKGSGKTALAKQLQFVGANTHFKIKEVTLSEVTSLEPEVIYVATATAEEANAFIRKFHSAEIRAYEANRKDAIGSAVDNITATLEERGTRYGKFTDHATITQRLKDMIHTHAHEMERVLAADQREAIDMICHKLGRIVNGDPNYSDSWVDIAGYAKLVADRLIAEGK